MVSVVKWLMILTAIVLSPLYGACVAGGWLADRMERRRYCSNRIPIIRPPKAA